MFSSNSLSFGSESICVSYSILDWTVGNKKERTGKAENRIEGREGKNVREKYEERRGWSGEGMVIVPSDLGQGLSP